MSLENPSRRKFLLGMIALAASAEMPFSNQGKQIEAIMKPEEAIKYINEIVHPRLARVASNPSQIPGVRNRLEEIFMDTKPGGPMLYTAMEGYHPTEKDAMLHVDYNPKENKPVLMVFVPRIKDEIETLSKQGYSQDEIDMVLSIAYAHEQIHYYNAEILKKYPSMAERFRKTDLEASARDEGEAWGVTIVEMIRPALARGLKLPINYTINSENLKIVGDNYNSPQWVEAFRRLQ